MSAEYEAAVEIREALYELRNVLQAFAEGDAVLQVNVSLSDVSGEAASWLSNALQGQAEWDRTICPGDVVECTDEAVLGLTRGAWYSVSGVVADGDSRVGELLMLRGSSVLYLVKHFRVRVRPCVPSVDSLEGPTF